MNVESEGSFPRESEGSFPRWLLLCGAPEVPHRQPVGCCLPEIGFSPPQPTPLPCVLYTLGSPVSLKMFTPPICCLGFDEAPLRSLRSLWSLIVALPIPNALRGFFESFESKISPWIITLIFFSDQSNHSISHFLQSLATIVTWPKSAWYFPKFLISDVFIWEEEMLHTIYLNGAYKLF